MAKLVQVALCTSDMPRTIRTFVEVLGFSSAGGRPRWARARPAAAGASTGDDTSVMLWWLVGRQQFGGQIELFHHTSPAQRPRRADWQPSDLGWSRFGVVVPDFDLTLRRLEEAGFPTITPPVEVNGGRRVCFREPGSLATVEVMEEDPALPLEWAGSFAHQPALAYVAVSVSDLDDARRYFGKVFGFTEIEPDAIHRPEHREHVGPRRGTADLPCSSRAMCCSRRSRYETPAPKPPTAESLLSDQGIMNVALGYRDRSEVVDTVAAAESAGATTTTGVPDAHGSMYLRIADGLSVELFLVPARLDASYGLEPQELAPPGSVYAPEPTAGR